MEGCIFNIQRFSVHDGPGIRTNVFLKGCPLRCIWCHNPEGLSASRQIKYSPDKCILCGDCAEVCDYGGHLFENRIHMLDFSRCVSCMKCAAVCPSDAIETDGIIKTVDEIIFEVLRDKCYFESSGGGMTLSGGEPFYQPEFALDLLKAAKKYDINCAVETCGMAQTEVFEKAAPFVDTFLFDYKATGDELHQKVTGASQKQILKNLEVLAKLRANVILRCPIIPGINDNAAHYKGIAETAETYNIKEINIMPYHSLGNGKRQKLGMSIEFSAETMRYDEASIIKQQIEKFTNLTVKII